MNDLEESQVEELAEAVEVRSFAKDTKIFTKGEKGNIFYMIQKGKVKLSGFGGMFTDVTLGPGEHFGERALMTGEPRAGDAKSLTECSLMMIDREF